MGSIKSWKFTQRFAGAVWIILGVVLALNANELREELLAMEKLEMMYEAIALILKQISWVVVSCLAINVIIFFIFNFKGDVRRVWKKLGAYIKEQINKSKQVKEKKAETQPKSEKRAPRKANPDNQQ